MTGFLSCPYSLVVPSLAAPVVIGSNTQSAGTGDITIALPAGHIANDILLLAVESAPVNPAPVAPLGGWVEVTGSPIADTGGVAADNTRLSLFWKRDNGAEANPQVLDVGDHLSGVVVGIRGCPTSGNPWEAVATGTGTGAQTSLTLPGITTTIVNCLIINFVGHGLDALSSAELSGWTNASLVSITEIQDFANTAGTGTGIGSAAGVLAAAGSSGTSTVTAANAERHAYITIALKGV